jgi:RNA polymerase sigma-70 factor (ECF subfamily)
MELLLHSERAVRSHFRMIPTMAESDPATSFEAAVRAHERELVSFAFRMMAREDAARDCVQDAFLKAHAALLKGASPDALRAWLYRLVYNAAVDRLRRIAVEERGASRREEKEREATPAGPGEELERLVGTLPSPYREILCLRYAYDFSYAEMESILGTPAATIRVYAARALEKVHAKLKEGSHGVS